MDRIAFKPPVLAEVIFDIVYLLFAATAGLFLIIKGGGQGVSTLYGSLALILGFGDAFHLLPRVYAQCTGTMAQHVKSLGFGKLVTSVTMTLFYVLLYLFWQLYYQMRLTPLMNALVFGSAIVRIILCLLPQNGWMSENPSFRFAIYRNIPFVILGVLVATLFGVSALWRQGSFSMMAPAIVLSFLFYLIVVLFAGKHPKLGMFMIPKTCTYLWMISMGFSLV